MPGPDRSGNGEVDWLTVIKARQNNLRHIDVAIPLRRFVCVTGVSGSGKSSLVNDIIRETLARATELGGRSTETDLHNQRGAYVPLMYSKTKDTPCPECGTPVKKISYLGGSCYLCPECQT